MGEVIDIRSGMQKISGTAHCMACKHEWEFEAYQDDVPLPCPACGTNHGLPSAPIVPDAYLQCECGSDAFYLAINPDRVTCRICGADMSEGIE